MKASDEVRQNRAAPFDHPQKSIRWLAFGLFSLSFGLTTVIAFRASRDPLWPDLSLLLLVLVVGATLVVAWLTRDIDQGGDSLVSWFDGLPGWFSLSVGAIAAVCMLAGGFWYFVLETEFEVVVQTNVLGWGALALFQLLPRVRLRSGRRLRRG